MHNKDNIENNAQVQAEAETGSATAGAASGATGQIGAAVGSDRADRSYTATTTDTDVGAAEAQKRGIALDSNNASEQVEILRQLSTQALQNAIETANMVSKQAVRHSDLAIDRQWNLDETNYSAAGLIPNQQSLITAMAVAVAKALKDEV